MFKSSFLRSFFFCVCVVALPSCVTSISNFDKYQKVTLSKADIYPSKEQLETGLPKVAVFSLEDGISEVSKNAGIGPYLAGRIENTLVSNKMAQVLERKAAEKLSEEIKLAEMKTQDGYSGPVTVDYIVSGSINTAAFSGKFSEAIATPWVILAPEFKYEAQVSGIIKIVELPSLRVKETIEVSGRATRSDSAVINGSVSKSSISRQVDSSAIKTRDDLLVKQAADSALRTAEIALKNIFSRMGFISERRDLDKKTIFKINVGKRDGIKAGDKLVIKTKAKDFDAVSGKTNIDIIELTNASVTSKITDTSSWIVLEDNSVKDKIKMGDYAQPLYAKKLF